MKSVASVWIVVSLLLVGACGGGTPTSPSAPPSAPTPAAPPPPPPPAPIFERTGTGATFFDLPAGVKRLHIEGDATVRCENFILWVGGRLVVNEILGTGCTSGIGIGAHYGGDHITLGGVVEVKSSIGINWKLTELR